ncbi:MAG: hypothetical protein R3Y09_06565 [Clostridia bacterium]
MRITKKLIKSTTVRNLVVLDDYYTESEIESDELFFVFGQFMISLEDVEKIKVEMNEFNKFVNVAIMKSGNKWVIEL